MPRSRQTVSDPQRGEIWIVRFDPAEGSEIQKKRPAVIINTDAIGQISTRIAVPLTSWQSRFKDWHWMAFVSAGPRNGLRKNSAADASQVRVVDLKRFGNRLGAVPSSTLEDIVARVALCIGYH